MWVHCWGVRPVARYGTTPQVLCTGYVSSCRMSWAGSPPEHIQTWCRERRDSKACPCATSLGPVCAQQMWGEHVLLFVLLKTQLFHPSYGHLQLFSKDFFCSILQHNMALLPPAVLQPTISTPFLHDSQCPEKLVFLWVFLLMYWLTLTASEWIQFFSHYPLLEAFPCHALLLHTFPAWFLWQR